MSFNPDYPVVLGLAGGAATGKTVTANALAPMANVEIEPEDQSISWTHLYFALPIYRMVAARQKIRGSDAFDRQCYEIHDTLLDVFKGYISYEELVDTTFEIASMSCPPDGKPRTFMQKVGTEICRGFDTDCWVKWMDRKIKEEHQRFEQEQNRIETGLETDQFFREVYGDDYVRKNLGVVISDVRFTNECDFIRNHPNGVLIKFVADPKVVAARIYNRDGVVMSKEQHSHASEQEINRVPDAWFNRIVDTSTLSVADQVALTKRIVEEALRA